MNHLDLCSGIGGFALAARWMGWETVAFCEIDKFCQKALAKNFHGVPIHDDLKTFNARTLRGTVDLLTAGYPCQPFSQAGRRRGTNDPRHLWPHVRRIINQARPTWIVCENVAGHITLGLDAVCADLEALAYSVQPIVIPACATGAPHRRDRVWIIAYSAHDRHQRRAFISENGNGIRENQSIWHTNLRREFGRYSQIASNASSERGWNNGRMQETREEVEQGCSTSSNTDRRASAASGPHKNQGWSADALVGSGSIACHAASKGLPDWAGGTFRQPSPLTEFERSGSDGKEREVERYFRGLDDGVSARLVRNRVSKLKALGNAIVPQVAFEIFKAITIADNALTTATPADDAGREFNQA